MFRYGILAQNVAMESSFVRFQDTRRSRAQVSKGKPIYLLTLLLNSTTWRIGKLLKLEITQVSKQVSCSYNKICSNGSMLIWAWTSEMFVHVLIQTAITFEILKSYRGFCIFLPIKDYTLWLCRLEVSVRSQVLKISFYMKAIFSHRSMAINSVQ